MLIGITEFLEKKEKLIDEKELDRFSVSFFSFFFFLVSFSFFLLWLMQNTLKN